MSKILFKMQFRFMCTILDKNTTLNYDLSWKYNLKLWFPVENTTFKLYYYQKLKHNTKSSGYVFFFFFSVNRGYLFKCYLRQFFRKKLWNLFVSNNYIRDVFLPCCWLLVGTKGQRKKQWGVVPVNFKVKRSGWESTRTERCLWNHHRFRKLPDATSANAVSTLSVVGYFSRSDPIAIHSHI